MKITRIDCHCLCGEGPVWDEAEQALYFLDIGRRAIRRYDPVAGTFEAWNLPGAPGSIRDESFGGHTMARL